MVVGMAEHRRTRNLHLADGDPGIGVELRHRLGRLEHDGVMARVPADAKVLARITEEIEETPHVACALERATRLRLQAYADLPGQVCQLLRQRSKVLRRQLD